MQKIKDSIVKFMKNISIINIFFATFGGIILGLTVRNIHSISQVTEGGMLGLTLLIDHWLHISSAITTPIISVICYLIALKILGKEFIFYSIFAISGYSITLGVAELFPPLFEIFKENILLSSICGGIGVGLSCGICVLANSGPTADDALALSLSHVFHCKITIIYLISDVSVLLLSLTYIPFNLIMYSLLTVLISGSIIGLMTSTYTFIKKRKTKETLTQEEKID